MSKQKGYVAISLFAIAILLITGLIAFSYKYFSRSQNTLTSSPGPEVSENSSVNMSDDWVYRTSKVCPVAMLIPPKKEPFFTYSLPKTGAANDNGRYWSFSESTDGGKFGFDNGIYVNYVQENPSTMGNGYTPGLIRVSCAGNEENLKTADLPDLIKRNYPDGEITSRAEISKWGKEIVKIDLKGPQGRTLGSGYERYLYADDKYIYFIDAISGSDNKSVIDTTEKILDEIRFTLPNRSEARI